MYALNSYLNDLRHSPVPIAMVTQVRGEYVSVIVATIDEHWESMFYPDGHVEVRLFVSTDWKDGEEALEEILASCGCTWQRPASPSNIYEVALAFADQLRAANVSFGFCLGTSSGGTIIHLATPIDHWEVTFEDVEPDSGVVPIAAERFVHEPVADMDGVQALAATLEWWERFDADDPTDVRFVEPPASSDVE